jgi:hypothetical protein
LTLALPLILVDALFLAPLLCTDTGLIKRLEVRSVEGLDDLSDDGGLETDAEEETSFSILLECVSMES